MLHSFESYADLELRFKGISEAAVTEEIDTSSVGDDAATAAATKARALMDRGLVRVVKRNYEGAIEDITAAHAVRYCTCLSSTHLFLHDMDTCP